MFSIDLRVMNIISSYLYSGLQRTLGVVQKCATRSNLIIYLSVLLKHQLNMIIGYYLGGNSDCNTNGKRYVLEFLDLYCKNLLI